MKLKDNVQTVYQAPLADCLSLFDDQFTIKELAEALEEADEQSNTIMDSAKEAIRKASNQKQNEEDYQYVLKMDQPLKKAIENGDVKFEKNVKGELVAQLRRKNGQYSGRIPIEKELKEEGISSANLEMAMQMEAIKQQLQSIIESLKDIEGKVIEVIQGQRNDRIGLFYSGLSLYVESRDMQDPFFQKQITAQALKSLSDANSQMIQDMRTNIQYLVSQQYKKSKHIIQDIQNHLDIIHQCFDVIYRASFLKAAIYQQNGEISAMLTAMEEYGRLVEKMIVPYVGKLSELDPTAKLFESSTWGTIAHTLIGCKELKKQITSGQVFYLERVDE